MCAGVAAQAGAASLDAAKLEEQSRAVDAKVIEWRRDIHQHPELSNRETRTAKLVAEHLKKLGLEVRTGIAHTGVTGFLKGGLPGPTIALRADMDALPVTEKTDVPFKSVATGTYRGQTVGVMHACGHDVHTAVLMGVAQDAHGDARAVAWQCVCSSSSPQKKARPKARRAARVSC